MKIIVLLSGGLDSATILAGCLGSGHECLAVAFDYGQPHRIELESAARIAAHYGVAFEVITIPALPLVNDVVFAGRNLVFASMAAALAQYRKFDAVATGPNASDWQRFPDCRPEFWRRLEGCVEAYGVKLLTPLIYLSKHDVVAAARNLGVPIELTWSCYEPNTAVPCGRCLACETREKALA